MIKDGSTIADAAQRYLALGLSVLPAWSPVPGGGCQCPRGAECPSPGKHPALPAWSAYASRQAAREEVDAWFSAPRNVALVTGYNDLLVIDCDDMDTYAAMLYALPELRHALTVETGKGRHIYTVSTEPVKTATFQLNGKTHHIKASGGGAGGIVIAPPSVHPSGRVYRFVDHEAMVPLLDPRRLAQGLRKLLPQPPQQDGIRNAPGWSGQLLRSSVAVGERHDSMVKLAGMLIHYNVPTDAVEAILELWVTARVDNRDHAMDAHEIERVVRSLRS